jgi:hypothetical protein
MISDRNVAIHDKLEESIPGDLPLSDTFFEKAAEEKLNNFIRETPQNPL